MRYRRLELLSILLAAVCLMGGATPAQGSGVARRTVAPLPASDYAVRSACGVPAPAHASCLALELLPRTPAARAHSRPLGMARRARLKSSGAAEICEAAPAAEGCYGLRPQDLQGAYSLPTTAPSTQTIALVDAYDDPNAEADLAVYDKEFHLPACTSANGCFAKVNENGASSPLPKTEAGWALEISLDIETAHAVCQNCHILLVEAQDSHYSSLESAEDTAAALGATEISNSWSGEEPVSDSAAFDHPHIAITAAAGDDGYLNWDAPREEERGFVGYPASSPHVVGVGGTRVSLTTGDAWAGETIWNDGSTVSEGYGAGGGGCSARFTAPPWQQGLPNWSSVGCASLRAESDVSADADPYTGLAVYDSTELEHRKGWGAIGGTSLASPLIAATFALAGGAGEVEYPARTLYENEAKAPGSLHDVTSGSNGECTQPFDEFTGVSGCSALEEADNSCSGKAICLAGPGYDGPSGVGTPDGVGAFEPVAQAGKTSQTIQFTSTAPSSATVGGAVYEVSAKASSGLTVAFASGTPLVCSLVGSTVSFDAAGTCTIKATQAGNSEYDPAPGVQQSFTVSGRSQTIQFTSSAPSSATVGGPVYEVSATASSGLPVLLTSGTPSVCALAGSTVSFKATGTCMIEASQSGDGEYRAALTIGQSFTVGKRSQLIAFTSTAPGAATVGGPGYAVAAIASSGLAVSLSSISPAVCTLSGSIVSFSAPGICTIDANQAGNSEYATAPDAQQSFVVNPSPVLGPSLTPPGPTPPTPTPPTPTPPTPAPPTPDSSFSLVGSPLINASSGAVTFTVRVGNPGTFTWLLSFKNGGFGAFASQTHCPSGQVRLDRHCRPARIVFARGVTIVAAGLVSFTATPGASARAALQRALQQNRGLPLTATLSFQSSLGGASVSHTQALTDALRKAPKKTRKPHRRAP